MILLSSQNQPQELIQEYAITRVAEHQVLDIISIENHEKTLTVVGSIREKFLVKPHLAPADQERVRFYTQQSERERHARHTMTLEDSNDHGTTKASRIERVGSKRKRITTLKTNSTNRLAKINRYSSANTTIKSNNEDGIPRGVLLPPKASTIPRSPAFSDTESYDTWSSVDASTTIPTTGTITSSQTIVSSQSRQSPHWPLLRTKVNIACDTQSSVMHKLEEELGKRRGELSQLETWLKERETRVRQLEEELNENDTSDKGSNLGVSIPFRLTIERERLKVDVEYQKKLAQVEETKAAIMLLEHRLRASTKLVS